MAKTDEVEIVSAQLPRATAERLRVSALVALDLFDAVDDEPSEWRREVHAQAERAARPAGHDPYNPGGGGGSRRATRESRFL
jgi:hypothetical protein